MSSSWTQRRRLCFATAATTVLSIGAAGFPTPAQAETPTPTPTPSTSKSAAEPLESAAQPDPIGAAMDRAKVSGEQVPVPSLTDMSSTTSANPDGTLTTAFSSTPQRVRQDGTWVPVDTTLVRQEDGTYAPKAATTGVSFGAGGSTALVTLKEGTKTLRFTWRDKLPEPRVSGDTATYAEILPGVDLQVTANVSGYTSTFVVKSAKAAADPAVQQLDLGLAGSGLDIAPARNGGAEATDPRTGDIVFQANTALMWDSSPVTDTPAGANRVAPAAEKPSTKQHGGRQAQVRVSFGEGKQTLTLDKALLTAKTTKFPVYVDPDWQAWTGDQSKYNWARISSNGWDVYNSTSTASSYSPRFGLDDWPTGAGEKARTYYQVNLSGVKGAVVNKAAFYLAPRWAASCYKTGVALYGAGTISGFNASKLYWGHEPARGSKLDIASAGEIDCDTSTPAVSPPSLEFNVTSYVQSKINGTSATFLVEAADMNDKYAWKQLKTNAQGGGKLVVNYSYRPKLNAENHQPHVKPQIEDNGRILTTRKTPALSWRGSNTFPNGVRRNIQLDYHVMDKTGKVVRIGMTGYSLTGSDWTVLPELPDGDYTWKVTARNTDGLWASGWSPMLRFTIDSSAPKAPTVKSAQFPAGQVGTGYADKGLFAFGNDRSNNVIGYLFTLDRDLGSTIYANEKGTPWSDSSAMKPGTIYFAKADNANGDGTVILNGTAGVTFVPGTAGTHRVFAKAVDQAGSTSPQTTYTFTAGAASALFAYGDDMINGWTAKNDDGTSTVVPKAMASSAGGKVQTQPNYSGYYFAHGFQGMLANSTGKVAVGDSATFSFNLPSAGNWEFGSNLTTGADYGTYSFSLDGGAATFSSLPNFDAYSSPTSTQYRTLGSPVDGTGAVKTLAAGLHTLKLTLTGKNASSAGYQAGIDVLRLSIKPTCAINELKGCMNNAAISTYTAGGSPAVTAADADGLGNSLDAADLRAAGWTPGATVTVNGTPIRLPATFGDGKNDNVLASGQIVTVPATGVINRGNALVFLGFGVNGAVTDETGRITYAAGGGCNVSSQAYTLDAVPDWTTPGAGNAVVTSPHRNKSNGTHNTGTPASLIAVSVPLVCPRSAITSITLPLVSPTVAGSARALHIVGLGIRPGSETGSGTAATRWAGTWSAAQDIAAVQTTSSVNATIAGQTLRIPARVSLGGGKVRIRLSNSIGTVPVTFDAATVALQDAGAAATAANVPLRFGGAASITIPAGGEALSDAADMTVADRATLLVSVKVRGTVTAAAGHKDAKVKQFITADGADHTGDTAATAFAPSTLNGLPWLAGIDVDTPAASPAGALVLFGDQTVNGDSASSDGRSQLSDLIADALATDESGTYPQRAGVLNQGSSSWGNRAKLPAVVNGTLPESALGAADRQILGQTNARIALISSGSSDLLACTGTAEACSADVETKLRALSTQLQQYQADDALDYSVALPSRTRGLKVYVATLPPFIGTHTAAQENARKLVNDTILGGSTGSALGGYADGAIDFAAAVSTDGTATTDGVRAGLMSAGNPNDFYYQALAVRYVLDSDTGDGIAGAPVPVADPAAEAIARWDFAEGSGTTVADTSAVGTGTPDNVQKHDATLVNGTWSTGRKVGIKAGAFNGKSTYADAAMDFDTGKSYAASAWVRLTDSSADRAVLMREGSVYGSFYLSYTAASNTWAAMMPSAGSGDSVTWYVARSVTKSQIGKWTHLGAVYDAAEHNLQLFVDGAPEAQVENVAPFNEPGKRTRIGLSSSSYFAGDIADVRVWRRTLGAEELESAVAASAMLDWQFENDSQAEKAPDSTEWHADGALRGGAAFNYDGHTNPNGDNGGWDVDWGSMTLNGTDGAVTTGARLLTDQSFTVTAWARVGNESKNQTVAGQDGAHTARFSLAWKATCKCWAFTTAATDVSAPVLTAAQSGTATAAGSWTYLAGVYDAAAKELRLYVNGELAATTAAPAAGWNATGEFTVGRSRTGDATTEWLAGEVDDVIAYQGVLDAADIKDHMTD